MKINPKEWFSEQVDINTIERMGDAFSKAQHILVNLAFVAPELSSANQVSITNALLAADRSTIYESPQDRYLRLLDAIKSAFLQTDFGKICQKTELTIADGFLVDPIFIGKLKNNINVSNKNLTELGLPIDNQTKKMLLNYALFWYFGGLHNPDITEKQREQIAYTVIRREVQALILNQNMPSCGVVKKYDYKQFDTYFIGDELIDYDDPILLCVVDCVSTLIDKNDNSGKPVGIDDLKSLVNEIYSTVKSDIAKGISAREALGCACYSSIGLIFSEIDSMLAMQKLAID